MTEMKKSDRGFKHGEPIQGTYGGNIRVYESSAAFVSRFWIKAESPVDINYAMTNPDADDIEMNEVSLHMSPEGILKLIKDLQYLYDNHYHREYYGTGDLMEED